MSRKQGMSLRSLSLETRIFGADSSRMGIGVGTPSRIIDLLDSGMA